MRWPPTGMILCRTAGCDGERVRERQSPHVASRNDLAFQRDFFTALSKELALPRAIATELPPGVVATARTDGDNAFIFLQNYSAQNHTLTLPQGYWDCLTDAAVSAPLTLSAWDCRILRRHA